jgi:hypothetical protein
VSADDLFIPIANAGYHLSFDAVVLDWLESDEINAVKKSTESIEEFISATLIDGIRATLPPEERFALEGLPFDKYPSIAEGATDDFARQ